MKLREFFFGIVIVSLSFVSANAMKVPLPSPLITEDKIIGSAYYHTLSILNTSNECSDFFGGPAASVDIFNDLMGKVRKEHFSPSIGIRMSGATVDVHSTKTNRRYRLFDKMSINANGAFYRKRYSNSQPSVPGVGTFEPSTKEARVLMFLHELGHVVKGEGGDWLLPDDGRDDAQSRGNTRKIEEVCGDQIKNLEKGDAVTNSSADKQEQPVEPLTPVETKP